MGNILEGEAYNEFKQKRDSRLGEKKSDEQQASMYILTMSHCRGPPKGICKSPSSRQPSFLVYSCFLIGPACHPAPAQRARLAKYARMRNSVLWQEVAWDGLSSENYSLWEAKHLHPDSYTTINCSQSCLSSWGHAVKLTRFFALQASVCNRLATRGQPCPHTNS